MVVKCGKGGDDEWDSDEDKSASALMTSPSSDQSTGREGVTSSPVSDQPEGGTVGGSGGRGEEEEQEEEAGGGEEREGGEVASSPSDKDLKEAIDSTVKSLSDRLSVSGGEKEEGKASPSYPKTSPKSSPPSPNLHSNNHFSTSKVKQEALSSSPKPTEVTMKEEAASTPSPPTAGPVPPPGAAPRGLLSPPRLAPEVEAARQQLASMIQGLPLLSMLPALHRLAPAAMASLASGLSSIVGGNGGVGMAEGGANNNPSSSSTGSNSSSSSSGGTLCVCGIRFSSASNLEAHRMFYCTHRPSQQESDGTTKESRTSPAAVSPRGETTGSGGVEEEDGGRVLRCPHCPYTTTHKLSLNGHMNIHTCPEELAKSGTTPQPTAPLTNESRATDRYCTDCDIQFSSVKTFRVHKAHYCQTRHVLKGGNKSPAREEAGGGQGAASVASSLANLVGAASSGQPILALPTNPILLVPYSLVAGAQLLPPHVLPQAGAAVVLPNGQVQPLSPGPLPGHAPAPPPLLSPSPTASQGTSPAAHSLPPQASPQSNPTTPPKTSPKEDSRIKIGNVEVGGKRRGERDGPLDLTTKRPKLAVKTDLLSDEEKENREVNTPTLAKSPGPKSRPGSSHGAGEFEGKLLASPPRPSPSSEMEGQSTPRSPRPASAAPALGSPRSLADSPRPSTSARSPGQPTQIPSGLPQLPPGFPNLLASLESGLSLAGLQSLQGLPPELTLKLLNPELLMNGLAPLASPPVIVKQGEAKCNECNIVFFKEENLQVHKKHYCAARVATRTDDERRPSASRSPAAAAGAGEGSSVPSRRSPTSHQETPTTTANKASPTVVKEAGKAKPLLQFICTACGIKFTSPDNLKAHQTYYCPKREGACGEEGVSKGLWRCPRCRCAMPETLQAAHQCVTPSPAPSHGWKCPCCPTVSPTAAAAQKHLDTHAGIKGFRCTICGYRGNTLRGMRTHIRMHFEKRTNDLQEENFISCIVEDDDGSRRAAEARGVADLPRVILENPTLSALLAEGGGECSDQPLTCHFCTFVTPFRTTLARHLAFAHKVGLDAKLTQDLQALLEGHAAVAHDASVSGSGPSPSETKRQDAVENGNPVSSPPLPAIKLEPEVKIEVEEVDDKPQPPQTSPHSSPNDVAPSEVPGQSGTSEGDITRYCKTCNITFSYTESFLAHKRFYCSKPESSTPPETAVQ
ncbi:hypothetical protein Pmani_022977 [Petrolisthes manimaculis]|uniref:Zinc finger protein ush n=1 Tax=Petrolisthes manimaculis TaxID=1843537 RepID=A0AAE1PC01_9EUCA|nr:hypothetical protein Pmani_022977 [Petrolisthes manimaculis]